MGFAAARLLHAGKGAQLPARKDAFGHKRRDAETGSKRLGKSHHTALLGKENGRGRKAKSEGLSEKLQKDFKPRNCPVSQL